MKNLKTNTSTSTKSLVMYGILTALTFVLQYLSIFIRTGTFSITLSLVTIVIGAAILGVKGGAWLGLVFGIAVLVSGDAAPFFAISVPGTILTVLLKGVMAGVLPGLTFKALKSKNTTLAVAVSSVLSPIANTGVFILGVIAFFLNSFMTEGSTVLGVILGFIGLNFFIELAVCIIFCPVIVRLLNISKKQF